MALRLSRAALALALALFAFAGAGCTDAGRCMIGTPGCTTGGGLCTNTCGPNDAPGGWANDGICDDGGQGSDWDACAWGTDCADCGERVEEQCPAEYPVFCQQGGCWAPGVNCWSVRECSDGQLYGCEPGYLLDCEIAVMGGNAAYCVPEDVCEDSCAAPFAKNGTCEDGGPSSSSAVCRLGTDCSDCTARSNPCDNASAFPVYCPATPDDCWSRRVDCDAVQYCGTSAYVCEQGQRVDCDAASGCSETACTDPTLPVDCGTGTCFAKGTDCTTVTTCVGGTGETACPFGFTVDCTVPLTPTCTPL